ncbi:MAG: coiled-coil domain-containing protein [Candidatus Helarchaeales archaeon]
MPIGIALFGWTNKEGFFLIDCYPESTKAYLDEETVMRIGSLHRMRRLDPNFITINFKNFKIASFFSGMKTSKYIITPNFTIVLLLDLDENAYNYSMILPTASREILQALSGDKQRFDSRIARIPDVLAAIGTEYKPLLPKVFDDIVNDRVKVEALSIEELLEQEGFAAEELSDTEKKIRELQDQIKEKDGVIEMLQKMLSQRAEESGSSDFGPSIRDYTNTIELLQRQLSQEKRAKSDALEKIQQLEAKMDRFPLLERKIREAQETLRQKDQEIANLNERIKELEEEIQNMRLHGVSTSDVHIRETPGRSRYIPL